MSCQHVLLRELVTRAGMTHGQKLAAYSKGNGWQYILRAFFCISAATVGTPTTFAIVTSDSSGSHVVSPGTTLGDGVALLEVRSASDSVLGYATGALLSSGTDILTAAHVSLTSNASYIRAYWWTSGNVLSFRDATLSASVVHPAYLNNSSSRIGRDLAVLSLSSAAATAVTRLDILRDDQAQQENVTATKYGYGRLGIGSSGHSSQDFALRSGSVEWEPEFRQIFNASATTLGYDFDSGSATYDNFDNGDLGFGSNEVSAAPGDSGGPTFVASGQQSLIAGVTATLVSAGGFGFADASSNFSSWGDFGLDVRVSNPLNRNFIDLWVDSEILLGDMNGSDTITAADIDLLYDAIGGSVTDNVDLNLDGSVNQSDVNDLVRVLLQTQLGDANLDGLVNADDSNLVALNFGKNRNGME